MMSQEIKANNTIEGIKDDLSVIDEVIKKIKSPISERERKRIINLFHGYQYILNNSDINKDNLRRLYDILSDGILLERDRVRMGEYYRSAPVYILKGNRLDTYPYMGMDSDKIDDYMDQFLHMLIKMTVTMRWMFLSNLKLCIFILYIFIHILMSMEELVERFQCGIY